MCNKNSPPPDMQTRSMTKKKKARETLQPARKTRTKTRKPKFLSLRLELSSVSDTSQNSTQMTPHHKIHTLFPLHPENLVEDKDIHDDNVALLFNTDSGATLNGLLSGVSSSEEDSLSPPSLTYAYARQDSEEGGGGNSASSKLVRTAMRNKERDASEEKWVCYSEVVEKKELEEVTSCAADVRCMKRKQGSLSLKLDYQGILNAWSDQAPLYLEGESPQIVPELHDEFLSHDGANVLMDGGDIWRVPEMGSNGKGSMKLEELEGVDFVKMRQRQASVLRYKQKRQNRLFSKRIRYEVRKLNAEKRPRMKGRFVKRS